MKMKKLFREKKGSALAFSLIAMFTLMVIGLGVVTVSVKERKMSSDTGKSTAAFQVADSAVEKFLQVRKDNYSSNPNLNLNAIATSMGGTCNGGKVSGTIASGEYLILFYNGDEKIENCDATIGTVTKIKSSGEYARVTRAVELDL